MISDFTWVATLLDNKMSENRYVTVGTLTDFGSQLHDKHFECCQTVQYIFYIPTKGDG